MELVISTDDFKLALGVLASDSVFHSVSNSSFYFLRVWNAKQVSSVFFVLKTSSFSCAWRLRDIVKLIYFINKTVFSSFCRLEQSLICEIVSSFTTTAWRHFLLSWLRNNLGSIIFLLLLISRGLIVVTSSETDGMTLNLFCLLLRLWNVRFVLFFFILGIGVWFGSFVLLLLLLRLVLFNRFLSCSVLCHKLLVKHTYLLPLHHRKGFASCRS